MVIVKCGNTKCCHPFKGDPAFSTYCDWCLQRHWIISDPKAPKGEVERAKRALDAPWRGYPMHMRPATLRAAPSPKAKASAVAPPKPKVGVDNGDKVVDGDVAMHNLEQGPARQLREARKSKERLEYLETKRKFSGHKLNMRVFIDEEMDRLQILVDQSKSTEDLVEENEAEIATLEQEVADADRKINVC